MWRKYGWVYCNVRLLRNEEINNYYNYSYCCVILCFYNSQQHPAGRELTSDWSINSFIMVVLENSFTCSRALDRKFSWSYKILTYNHYKIILQISQKLVLFLQREQSQKPTNNTHSEKAIRFWSIDVPLYRDIERVFEILLVSTYLFTRTFNFWYSVQEIELTFVAESASDTIAKYVIFPTWNLYPAFSFHCNLYSPELHQFCTRTLSLCFLSVTFIYYVTKERTET